MQTQTRRYSNLEKGLVQQIRLRVRSFFLHGAPPSSLMMHKQKVTILLSSNISKWSMLTTKVNRNYFWTGEDHVKEENKMCTASVLKCVCIWETLNRPTEGFTWKATQDFCAGLTDLALEAKTHRMARLKMLGFQNN